MDERSEKTAPESDENRKKPFIHRHLRAFFLATKSLSFRFFEVVLRAIFAQKEGKMGSGEAEEEPLGDAFGRKKAQFTFLSPFFVSFSQSVQHASCAFSS